MNLAPHNVENRQLFKFRLNIGQAVAVNAKGEIRLYRQGQRIETPTHLTKRFGNEKFTRLSDADNVDEGERFDVEIDNDTLASINADDTGEWRERSSVSPDDDRTLGQEIDKFDSSATATYNAMSLDELVKLAADEEISLGSGKLTKKYVIQKLVEADHARAGH